ncbi:MAG TPA: alpha-glucosidase, partial [Lachnospiraceae bacterium]|nr:alpha-glucosidase [Lachnospiraceae bacterium]
MFGRLLSFEPDATGVTVKFEHKEGRISFITDRIVRVYSSMEEKHRPSRAVVQEPKKVDFQARQQKEFITIKTKKLLVRVRDEFQVDFLTPDGRMISEQTERTTKKQEITAQQAELLAKEGHELPKKQSDHTFEVVRMLHTKEHIYGLGDKTGFLDKRGYAYEMWNSDIPDTHADFFPSLYKSVPFFISMRPHFTYGIFLDNTSKSYFDMGKEEAERYYFAADGGDLDYYFIAGETMRDILGAYTGLTGRTALPQKWTLGYHQSRWGYITEDDIMDVAEKMRQCRIPCDSIHFDIDYMDAFKVFTWNRKNYKDPKKTLQKLTEMGYKPVTIIDPGVKKEDGYDVYEEGIKNGYFAFSAENELYVNEVWPGDAVFPSFTNPKVRSWWADKQKFLIDMGVRGVWNDMNEPASFKGPLPDDVQFADEDDTVILHKDAHNIYGHCMAMATKDGWLKYDGRRPFIITRAAYAGTQRYALVWTGDNQSIWAHLQMAIPQLCNLGLSGFSYAGTDVGGFGADTTKELLARWVQVGCLSPFFRNHSAQGTRRQEPWQFDKELLEIYRKYVELRYHLLPYIYDCFFESEQTGLPIMRPLMLN